MSLILKDRGVDFLPAPEGLHLARCYAVIDMGLQTNPMYGNCSPKLLIGWELIDTLMPDGRPFIQFQRFTSTLSARSHLRALLEAWRGRSFTEEELNGFHLKSVLGVPCCLTTKHKINAKTRQIWSHISSISPLPKEIRCPEPFNDPILFDLDHYTEESYSTVPEGIRKKINLESLNVDDSSQTSSKGPTSPAEIGAQAG